MCAHWSGLQGKVYWLFYCADLATERERQLTTVHAIKQLAWPMAERQIGYRKSSLVLSAHFPVVKWRSRSVANVGDGDVNENGKKEIGIRYQNNNFARASRFFAHFFVVTALLRRETHPNFTFWEDMNARKRLSFSFSELPYYLLEFISRKKLPTFDESNEME